ncbi:hypothetical protein CN425_27020 [Bacillus cereus]|uniref:Uncharacterized protein n=1 Tax=Bacillus cereus TaxID=1396 RepID=A0A2A8PN65_BACCE|nr:hypothetical protein CON38_25635 [Bacillus cereus]PEV95167.1 hypothetical protein CN425_27020 [Bacillus cereus]
MKELREEKNVERIKHNKIKDLLFVVTYQEVNEQQDDKEKEGGCNLPLFPIISQYQILNTYGISTLILINKVSDSSI